MRQFDFVIGGAGITGLCIATELQRRKAGSILILEKEPALGLHASGRNSGILHAGVYYPPETLKARLCLSGNRFWKQFCHEHRLPLMDTGKVIVCHTEGQLPSIQLLADRAKKNGASVEIIDEAQLAQIEPHAWTFGKALWVKDTATVDPKRILHELETRLTDAGVLIERGVEVLGPAGKRELRTSAGQVGCGVFINAAGAHAEQIAVRFGLAKHLRLMPFRGSYRQLAPDRRHLVRGNIYPLPDLENPFLGVHFSRSTTGEVYVGPTAAPVFGREQYGRLPPLSGEMLRLLWWNARLLITNRAFRANARAEIRRYGRGFFREASRLIPQLRPGDLVPSKKRGIRPQLVDTRSGLLVMDFMVEQAEWSLHVLNAVSPAFTSAPAFAQFLVDEYRIDRSA